jgi:hypothetical protein
MRDPVVRIGLQRDALQQSSSQLNSGRTEKQKNQTKNRRFDRRLPQHGKAQPSLTRLGLMAACHPTTEKTCPIPFCLKIK